MSIVAAVVSVKLWFIIWKQMQILRLLNRICNCSIRDHDNFSLIAGKLRSFMKFSIVFIVALNVAALFSAVLPLLRSERTFFFKIAFPLDWKPNEIAFWTANLFIFAGNALSIVAILFSVIIWYLMLNCSLRYEVLGNELRTMGAPRNEETENKTIISRNTKDKVFR